MSSRVRDMRKRARDAAGAKAAEGAKSGDAGGDPAVTSADDDGEDEEPSAGLEAADVRGDLGYQLGHGWPPGHVRHDRNLGMKPERAFRRQRLGPECVQGGV